MEYPHFTLSDQLTQEQIEFFDKYGFIHFKNFIDAEKVKSLIQGSLEVQDIWIKEDLKKVNGVPIKYGYDIDGKKIVQRFAFTSLFNDVLHNFLEESKFKALYPLLGENAMDPRIGEDEKDGMVFNHYINTENSKYTRLGWHTDGLRDVFYGKKMSPMLNVGVHLSDAVPDNGGLRLIPGTHKQNIFNLLFRKKYFIDHNPDKEEIGLITKAGDLTVHDGRLWHRVQQSNLKGEISRRRVIYIPIICGEYSPKHSGSSTKLYQRFSNVIK